MTPEEVLRHRPRFHELLAAKHPWPAFAKVHEACIRTAGGALLFPKRATAGAVHIVRNPLDVAVSFAHHSQCAIDRTIDGMNDPAFALTASVARGHAVLPQPLLCWSGHVSSWLDQRELPVHTVRYEDLLAEPAAAFGAVVRFVGLDFDAARVARAVGHCRFERLRAQEERFGFDERQPTAPSFFRSGGTGGWRTALSAEQVRSVVDAHAPIMDRLGYLNEARAFLGGAR